MIDMVNHDLRPVVHDVIRLTPDIVEVVCGARAAARFEPGQFYRLQNFETLAHQVDGTTLAMEGLALTGASVDKAQGLLSLIVMEMGGSSDLCALLKAGDPVILMGPTGSPTEIGGGDGLSGRRRGLAMRCCSRSGRRAGSAATGWSISRLQEADRPLQGGADRSRRRCRGLVLGRSAGVRRAHRTAVSPETSWAMRPCGGGTGAGGNPAGDVDRIVAIGSDRMMQAVAVARHTVWRVPEAGTCGGRVDQQPDAMHDEGNLRAVPSDAPRSGDGEKVGGVLLLQPGSGA